jgi:DNA-binding CsgD family transcriptional regulator
MAEDDDPSFHRRLTWSLGAYGSLYPSMAGRIRVIKQSQDPLIRERLEALDIVEEGGDQVRLASFAGRYRLTPAEARIALHLAGGGDIAGYAAASGVSPGTVRTHLKAVFAKTGVHRQAALANLVARAIWAGKSA